MNPIKQKIAIAEFCGLAICHGCHNEIDPDCCHCGSPIKSHGYGDGHLGIPMGCTCGYADQPQHEWYGIPDYLNSLDAIHEVEKVLTEEQRIDYLDILYKIASPESMLNDDWNLATATAAQRAEAFLKTINK